MGGVRTANEAVAAPIFYGERQGEETFDPRYGVAEIVTSILLL